MATTGPAFTESRPERPDLRATFIAQDAHPGIHDPYVNACSLLTIHTGESPVWLPTTLRIPERHWQLIVAADDARYLQELYGRSIGANSRTPSRRGKVRSTR